MKPVKQTKFGENGNCFRACIASLLEVEISVVPAFEDMGLNWLSHCKSFLSKNGCDFKGAVLKSQTTNFFEKLRKYGGIDGYVIVGGKSPRHWRNGHSVIYKNGMMVHDPHPSNEGLSEIEDFLLISKL